MAHLQCPSRGNVEVMRKNQCNNINDAVFHRLHQPIYIRIPALIWNATPLRSVDDILMFIKRPVSDALTIQMAAQ